MAREQHSQPPGAALTGKAKDVGDLLWKMMAQRGYSPDQMGRAMRVWETFVAGQSPRISKPGAFAAAVEYFIVTADDLETKPAALAEVYGTSSATLTKWYNQIVDAVHAAESAPFSDAREMLDYVVGMMGGEAGDGAAEALALSPDDRDEIEDLPTCAETWMGGARAMNAATPVRLVLWTVAGEGVVSFGLQSGQSPRRELFDSLLWAMQKPMLGEPRRPATVVVEDAAFAADLKPVVQPFGIDVQARAIPALDGVIAKFQHKLGRAAMPTDDADDD